MGRYASVKADKGLDQEFEAYGGSLMEKKRSKASNQPFKQTRKATPLKDVVQ